MVIEADPISDHAAGVLQSLEAVAMLIRPCFVTSCPRRTIRRVANYMRQRGISTNKHDESMRRSR